MRAGSAALAAAGLSALPATAAARADASLDAGDADRDAVCFVGLSLVNTVLARRGDALDPDARRRMTVLRYAIPFYVARLSARYDDEALDAALAEGRPAYDALDDKGAATAGCYRRYESAKKRTTGALQALARDTADHAGDAR